jgi:uncharacterized UPF0146 family protein
MDRSFSWASDIVAQYASVLEHGKGVASPLFSESALPASKNDVKEAIIIDASVRRANDDISDPELEIYRTCYMLLMNAVPDERADALGDALTSIESAGGVEHLPGAKLRDAARKIGSAFGERSSGEAARQGATLLAEFDDRLERSLRIYRSGTA